MKHENILDTSCFCLLRGKYNQFWPMFDSGMFSAVGKAFGWLSLCLSDKPRVRFLGTLKMFFLSFLLFYSKTAMFYKLFLRFPLKSLFLVWNKHEKTISRWLASIIAPGCAPQRGVYTSPIFPPFCETTVFLSVDL